MKKLAIYGAGGLGREVACMIERINEVSNLDDRWNLIGFFDDGIDKDTEIGRFGKCLGGIDDVNAFPENLDIALCFGSPRTIQYIASKITNPLVYFPNIIDPSVRIQDHKSFCIGRGNIITASCCFTTNIRIGDFNLFNGAVAIGHDTQIGNFNVFMPACRISGEVSIGEKNLFGSMSFVKQCIKISDNITISPLSALLTKPKTGLTYIGNPAKVFKF